MKLQILLTLISKFQTLSSKAKFAILAGIGFAGLMLAGTAVLVGYFAFQIGGSVLGQITNQVSVQAPNLEALANQAPADLVNQAKEKAQTVTEGVIYGNCLQAVSSVVLNPEAILMRPLADTFKSIKQGCWAPEAKENTSTI